MKKKDKWSSYRRSDGSVDFDALPANLKRAFAAEGAKNEGIALSPAKRRKFDVWKKRTVGRPRVGEGSQRWNVSLEKGFARRLAAYAKSHGITRSKALAEGAKLLLSRVA